MTDDPERHWVLASVQIDLRDAVELRYWTQEFQCSAAQLRDAVHEVGANAGLVRAYLRDVSRAWP